jgi:hypothetical protein
MKENDGSTVNREFPSIERGCHFLFVLVLDCEGDGSLNILAIHDDGREWQWTTASMSAKEGNQGM